MNQLNNFGYPAAGDNVRVKPIFFTENFNFQTAGFINLFSQNITQTTRNKQLPLSGSEIVVIDEIKIKIFSASNLISQYTAFSKSYFQIIKNGKELYKANLLSMINFTSTFSMGTSVNIAASYDVESKSIKFKYPVVINSKDSIVIRIYTPYSSSPTTSQITMKGVSYDKLNSFDYDERKQNDYEQIDYQVFDVLTIDSASAAKDYTLFDVQNKAENLFSKGLLFSAQESFSLENIRIIGRLGAAQNDQQTILSNLVQYSLLLNGESQELLNLKDVDVFSYLAYRTADVTVTTGSVLSTSVRHNYLTSGVTLKQPVILKANSNNRATLQMPSNGSSYDYLANDSLVVCFNGTLIRKVL